MQLRPVDDDTAPAGLYPALPGLDGLPAPYLALLPAPAQQDHLPDDWTMVGPLLIAGRTVDRVVVGPNGAYAVSLDPDPRAATLTEDGLFRGGERVTAQVKQALAAAFAMRRILVQAGIDVFPYPVLVARGADGMLGRLRVVAPGCLASAVWRHPGRPMLRSQRARVLAAVQHPATS
jgi:hypothetical protein